MNRQQLLDIVDCLERANKNTEGKASLSDYFGQLHSRFTIYDDIALAGVMVEVECMGQVLFIETLCKRIFAIYGSGGYVYMSHELAMALCSLFVSYSGCQTLSEKTVNFCT